MKNYEIFTTKYSVMIQAMGMMEAYQMFLVDNVMDDDCYVIAIVDTTHLIAKEFKIR